MNHQTYYRLLKIAEEGNQPTDNWFTKTFNGAGDLFKDFGGTMNNWFFGDDRTNRTLSWGIGSGLATMLLAQLFGSNNPWIWGLLGGAGGAMYGYNYTPKKAKAPSTVGGPPPTNNPPA
jgi:hypothetical protein